MPESVLALPSGVFDIPEIVVDVGAAPKQEFPLSFGGNICLRGVQDSGKSKLMVAYVVRAISRYGYSWNNTVGNLTIYQDRKAGIYQPGYRYMNNERIKKWVRKVYRTEQGEHLNQIIMIDEIDQVYSHRDSMDKEDEKDLLTLWQDKKLGNIFIYTKHVGRGCNNLIRGATEISIKPVADKAHDILYGMVIDGFYNIPRLLTFTHASRIHNRYWRWEPIH